MRFDMSRAWNDALAAIGANREVMMVIAGIFFLLPSLVFSFMFADVQMQAMTQLQQMMQGQIAQEETALAGAGATFFVIVLVMMLFQMVGYTAMLALLDDRDRPTVGEALSRAIKFLPTLIGMMIVLLLIYFLCAIVVGVIVGVIAGAIGSVGLGILLGLIALIGITYILTRLSLAVAVVVFETRYNPVSALIRSWRLTGPDSFRLYGFYVLLVIVYFVISIIVGVVVGLLGGLMGTGTVGLIFVGLVSGAISAVVTTIFVGILAAVYRQLAGPSTANLNQTFG